MLDLRDIFTYLLLISYSCTISAIDSHSNLISPQLKHKSQQKNENKKVILQNPFDSA